MSNRPLARLAWPLAISLALHLCIAVLFTSGAASSLRSAKAVTLTVLLPGKEQVDPPPAAAAPPLPATPATAPDHTGAPDAAGNLTQKARFLAPPDLSILETIPVTISGSLTLRLNVSALGTVDRVTVVKSDPVPKELRDGLVARFQEARLTPALAGSKAVASTLELVIRYESTPSPLMREP